jgi:hypothetical protein
MMNKIMVLLMGAILIIGKANAQYFTNNARYTETAFFDSTQITVGTNIQYGTALDFQGNPYVSIPENSTI